MFYKGFNLSQTLQKNNSHIACHDPDVVALQDFDSCFI